uniref:Rieske domain-containing protein n=1 Tax=Alexandrium andersonii TaxID=327968 RepID=A0A7S2JEG4_9DINO|mmetsp:Transcript_99016/g.221858  ORF Transcript_99016/g.221858 Transcript_99016/m.221858 type:complete len:235 (+) Transcript_99016:99-803(+)
MALGFASFASTSRAGPAATASIARSPELELASSARCAAAGSTGLGVWGVAASAAALAAASMRRQQRGRPARTARRYTTQKVETSFQWLKTGFKASDLGPGDFRTIFLAGCDVCVGKTQDGKLFAVGDKAPPTGVSFSVGGEVRGSCIEEFQYGNQFDVFTGLPVGEWCPSPPLIGPVIGAFMGGPQAVYVFDVREGFFGGDVEVSVDTNAKKAYEADYWKGLLDAQGKVDGTYY